MSSGQGAGGTGGDGAGATGGGDQGGGGGVGGSAQGGGGAGPLLDFDCEFELSEHIELDRTENTNRYYASGFLGVRRDASSARLFLGMGDFSQGDSVDIFTVLENQAPIRDSLSGTDLQQARRVSVNDMGVLYVDEESFSEPVLQYLSVQDSELANAFLSPDQMTAVGAFPDLDRTSPRIEARFAVVSAALNDPVLDVVAWWRKTDDTYQLGYARYSGSPITSFTEVSSMAFDDDDDAQVQLVVHEEGTTYAFVGESSSLGTRRFELRPGATFPQDGVLVGEIDQFIVGGESRVDRTRLAMIDLGPPLELRVGAADDSMLGSLDPDNLATAASFDDLTNFPVFPAQGTFRFHDDLLAMVGGGFPTGNRQDPFDLTYWFIDMAGNERALDTIPIGPNLPTLPNGEERTLGLVAGTTVPLNDDFATAGGRLHVFFMDTHERGGDTFNVLYYNRLQCVLE